MIWSYAAIAAIYTLCVGLVSQHLVKMIYAQSHRKLDEMNDFHKGLENEKLEVNYEMKELEAETDEIFTLYEMTKEVSKQFDDEEAFSIFKKYLRDNAEFEDCLLLEPNSHDLKSYQNKPDYFLFTLSSKRRKLGILVIKNIAQEDKEKIFILGHQYALTLRRLKLYNEVEQLAITDSLTELHTRRYFMERFEEELKRSNSRGINCSFLMIDVDYFKKCNDDHGHLTGDQVLREVGGIIQESIREIDIAGRYGGEEFCVVLPDTDVEGAKFVAERIRSAAENQPIRAYDATIKVTLSIGAATAPQDDTGSEGLISKADKALYQAKEKGRNKVVTYSKKKT